MISRTAASLMAKGMVKNKQQTAASSAAKAQRFAAMLNKNKSYDQKLRKTCVEMESLFVKQMLSVMRKTIHKTGFISGGQAEKIFTDMLDDKRALSMSENQSFGLSRMLYKQLSGGKEWKTPPAVR